MRRTSVSAIREHAGGGFLERAAALYSVMVDITRVEQKEFRGVNVTADDQEQLLVEWLNSLLAVSDIERMVFSKFESGWKEQACRHGLGRTP